MAIDRIADSAGEARKAALEKFVDRYFTAQAVFLVGLAIAVNGMWIVFLGYLICRLTALVL
jgi:hypothetical protein